MYFYMQEGKQHMDFRNDLVLTLDDAEVKALNKSAAPGMITKNGGRVFTSVRDRPFRQKVAIVFVVIRFLWGKNK